MQIDLISYIMRVRTVNKYPCAFKNWPITAAETLVKHFFALCMVFTMARLVSDKICAISFISLLVRKIKSYGRFAVRTFCIEDFHNLPPSGKLPEYERFNPAKLSMSGTHRLFFIFNIKEVDACLKLKNLGQVSIWPLLIPKLPKWIQEYLLLMTPIGEIVWMRLKIF